MRILKLPSNLKKFNLHRGSYAYPPVHTVRFAVTTCRIYVPTHVVTLAQVITSVYMGQELHFKFLLGSERFHLGQQGMTISLGM